MTRTRHFRSRKAYIKWLAYGNIHHVFKHHAPYEKIVIGGHTHKVMHHRGLFG